MALAAATFAGIHNENEFYSHHYLSEIFTGDIKETVKQWQQEATDEKPAPHAALRTLARDYTRFRDGFERRAERSGTGAPHRQAASRPAHGRQIAEQRRWHRRFLHALGYENDWRPANHVVDDRVELPVLCATSQLLVLEAYDAAAEGDDPLSLKPHLAQFHGEAPPLPALLDERWEEIATRRVFGQEHPPRWVLLLSFGQALLLERSKWTHNRALRFDLAEILGRRDDATLKATAVLLHRDSLLPSDGQSHGLLDRLDENSHKHAFAVSEDLKYALRESIELVGNEVVRYMRDVRHDKLFDLDDALASTLGLECLRYMYRLLFLFYIESRPELGYAPVRSDAYRKGYALEHLRDLEMVQLTTDESRNGYYLHHSIERLFRLVRDGFDGSNWGGSEDLFARGGGGGGGGESDGQHHGLGRDTCPPLRLPRASLGQPALPRGLDAADQQSEVAERSVAKGDSADVVDAASPGRARQGERARRPAQGKAPRTHLLRTVGHQPAGGRL